MVGMYCGILFISQIICCAVFKNKFWKYLPTLIALFFISVTVLNANMGMLDAQKLVDQTVICLVSIGTVLMYPGVMAVWDIMIKRRDPVQRLRK